jgi:hypothetical protein
VSPDRLSSPSHSVVTWVPAGSVKTTVHEVVAVVVPLVIV